MGLFCCFVSAAMSEKKWTLKRTIIPNFCAEQTSFEFMQQRMRWEGQYYKSFYPIIYWLDLQLWQDFDTWTYLILSS